MSISTARNDYEPVTSMYSFLGERCTKKSARIDKSGYLVKETTRFSGSRSGMIELGFQVRRQERSSGRLLASSRRFERDEDRVDL